MNSVINNKKTIAFLFAAMFVLLNILFIFLINNRNHSYENNLLADSIVLNLNSKYSLVKNEKVISDVRVNQGIMVPLEFFISNINQKCTYSKNADEVKIICNNKELIWQAKTNIRLIITEGNSRKQIEYTDKSADSIGSIIYFPLNILTEFFDMYYYNERSLIIIDSKENIYELKSYISKNKGLIDRLVKITS